MKYKLKIILREPNIDIANDYSEYLSNRGLKVSRTTKVVTCTGDLQILEELFKLEAQYDQEDFSLTGIEYTVPEEISEHTECINFHNKLIDLYKAYGTGDIIGSPNPITKEELEEIGKLIKQERNKKIEEDKKDR